MVASAVRSSIERSPYRLAAVLAMAAALILVYGVLALGLVGEEGDPFDRIYAVVLAVAIVGALVARFRPHGMSLAMYAAAATLGVIALVALAAGKHRPPATSIPELVGLHAMFIAMFGASALLFRRASEIAGRDGKGDSNG